MTVFCSSVLARIRLQPQIIMDQDVTIIISTTCWAEGTDRGLFPGAVGWLDGYPALPLLAALPPTAARFGGKLISLSGLFPQV